MDGSQGTTKPAYGPIDSRRPWWPGSVRHLPWLGLLGILGAILGISASVGILIASDDQEITRWKVQPTVYLAIASALTNIMLHLALDEGVTIAWWRRAMKPDITVADLHRRWHYRDSLWAATTAGRYFDVVALASVLVAFIPINGPLLQRASKVVMRPQETPISISVPLAQELPDGYTGLLSGRAAQPALLSSEFVPIVRSYNNQEDIGVNSTGCNGRCRATVKAAGFAVNCSSSTAPYSWRPYDENGYFSAGHAAVVNGTTVFMTFFDWNHMQPGTINMNVQYKGDRACEGELTVRNCTLSAATTEYKVLVDSNRSAINIDPDTTIHDDVVDRILSVAVNSDTGPSTLGGMWLALNNKLRSTAQLRFVGARGYELVTTGATAIEYALVGADLSGLNNCSLNFDDPTELMLASARELIFRTAVAAAAGNDSRVQTVQATQARDRAVYESNMLFLALATAATALGTLAVLPTFYGYWTLGRTTSLSPIETAKAFNAPLLRSPDSNAEVDELLKDVGGRRVRYGVVTCKDQGALPNDEAMSSSGHPCETRLEMADPDHVRPPPVGGVFSGY